MSDGLPQDAPWWARAMVDNWPECWKWLSTWLTAIAASAPVLYETLPQVREAVPESAFHWISATLVLLIFFGRIKRQ